MSISYEKLMTSIEETALIGGWWYDIASDNLEWTSALRAIHEVEQDYEPRIESAITFYNEAYAEQIKDALQLTVTTGKAYKIKASITTAKGNVKWVFASGMANYEGNKLTATYGVFQDITADVIRAENLIKTNDITQITLDSLVEGVVVINAAGKITKFNQASENIFKYHRRDIIGKPIEILMPEPHRNHHQAYLANYHETKVANIVGIGREVIGLKSDGTSFPMHISINSIDGPSGQGFVGTIRDLTEEKQIKTQLDRLSHYDNLTGLPNRVSLINYLQKADSTKVITLIAINLHDFKKINLAYDFAEGDVVLKALAQRLTDFTGLHHFAAKDIADRFWLVIDHRYIKDLENCIIELMSFLKQAINGDKNRRHHISICMGVASSQNNDMLSNLITRAETALFSAKQKGINEICYFENLLAEQIISKYQIETDLRVALGEQALECWLQPKVNQDFKTIAAEVLVRWKGKDGQYIPPDEFIHIAEKTGLIMPLGAYVANKTAQMLAQINKLKPDFTLAMNVSPIQFLQANFAPKLVACFDSHQANLANLTIEITETLLIGDVKIVTDTINELGRYGIRISIDDFGTGHSNLKRIIDMPIFELKIDKQFVNNCLIDKKSEHLLSAIVSMSKVMDYSIVAEGVESLEIAKHCINLGVDILQGYYFGKAEPYRSFVKKHVENVHAVELVSQ